MKVAYFILNPFDYDSRARLETETLRSAGYDVEIIAAKGGESKNFNGMPIHRIAQISWPSRKMRFIYFNLAASKKGRKLKADIYHAVDLDTLYAAYAGARANGGKLIYESRELYTELEALNGREKVRSFWERVERRLIPKVDKIITINSSIAREMAERYGIETPAIIRNVAARPSAIQPVDLRMRLKIPSTHKIIVYQGILRTGQGLDFLLELLKHLNRVTVVFLGDGPLRTRLEQLAAALGVDNRVRFAGMITPDELVSYTAGADAGALLMEGVALNNRLALPQKLFQYAAAGIPQIVSPMPEIAGFVENEGTGLVIPLDDVESGARKIDEFLFDDNRMAGAVRNCKEASIRYNWDVESSKLIEIYRDLERGG